MKFMLMMHAPRGNGDYQTNQWKPEEFRANIQFMINLNKGLVKPASSSARKASRLPARHASSARTEALPR